MTATPEEIDRAESLARIEAKLDYIIATVEQTVGALAKHPMLKMFGG